ncbi:MAG: RNA polymerase subunit sigma-70 [Bacteroidetes bacterium CG02_land_8_20_14_3_00_31_25]|nr:sigma-70 family RNA polymerase sigma factor [Bacteroidota bacterium]PIV62614.1 MAG: RNA polymerase subunit sigma-70 [Bacteroidetes bacterium CG02_land_8_20_14_3_00_31_25]PIY04803.1 MAG: RNA polymerase subunit sigma-70 [Bacteroidetes bacterium CG_4_10_14_3_um_filter_31_20]
MINLTNKDDVKDLVESCIKGNRKSQELLYKTFYGKMLVVCMRYSRNREEAQDVLHDGLIKVFSKLKSFENKGSFEGWVRRIIVNVAIDRVRSRKDFYINEEQEFLLDNIVDESDDVAELEKIKKMNAETIIELMQKLSPSYRAVLNLFAVENMQHKEIAETLNISIGTSKSNLAKAKVKLKELLEQYRDKLEYE